MKFKYYFSPLCGRMEATMKINVRKIAAVFLVLQMVFLASCAKETGKKGDNTSHEDTTAKQETTAKEYDIKSNRDLYNAFTQWWKNGDTYMIYDYSSKEITELCNRSAVDYIFNSITDVFGKIESISDAAVTSADGTDVYSAAAELENAYVDFTLSLKNSEISGFVRDIRFKGEFDVSRGKATEHYFTLNGLNAVYTSADGAEKSPAVLLISGSGPSDYNETVGILTPFEDMALSLAEKGISSLRLEKRTQRYAADFKPTDGMEEEYFADCRAAIKYLKDLDTIEEIYLVGHSLGGQVAAKLAAEEGSICGMTLLMSSPRHLADICCDQYTAADKANAAAYSQYRDAAKLQNEDTAGGKKYYYGVTDAYWASYNSVVDTVSDIRRASVPALIINSSDDLQIFDADIQLWRQTFDGDENVTLKLYDDMSHFGYKINAKNPAELYARAEFPREIIDDIASAVEESKR